jgi:hypothetical protein
MRQAGCVFLVLALSAAANPAEAQERPFFAYGTANNVSGNLIGTGQGTHLGRFDFTSNGLSLDPFENTLQLQTLHFMAASGDILRMNFDENLDFDPQTGLAVGSARFTDGTGRFQDVIGSADVIFLFDENLNADEFRVCGSIDY